MTNEIKSKISEQIDLISHKNKDVQPEKPFISPKVLKKLNPTERKAVKILNKNPELNNNQIGKELKKLGLTKDDAYVCKRVKKSELLRLSLSNVRHINAEILSKRIVPRALKEHEAALKDKELTREQKFKWVKLAEDKEFGSDERRMP